eukprot:TRINITY_DN1915_c0_g1_i1.p1 TRINITY_DN1915_c0_g1~~TRINITY_DN1915_c0_g1_i1.p1  ORF type:complete len:360 (+),score=92.03 TRINITY_DN1915_c0_g1_i1:26-1105(+)
MMQWISAVLALAIAVGLGVYFNFQQEEPEMPCDAALALVRDSPELAPSPKQLFRAAECVFATNAEEGWGYLERAAEGGYSEAQFELALQLVEAEELDRAVQLLTLSAEQGHADAAFMLAQCYLKAIGVFKDETEAIVWLKRAAAADHPKAHAVLAEVFLSRSEYLPMYMAAKSAVQNHQSPRGYYYLGLCYQNGHAVKPDLPRALEMFKNAAQRNDSDAAFVLGARYLHGTDVEKNEKLAVEYLTQAAKFGHPAAMYNLAICYEQGLGVEPDLRAAKYYFEHSAGFGFPDAIFTLGVWYYNGDKVEEDEEKACQLFEQAAALGHEMARFNAQVCKENQEDVMVPVEEEAEPDVKTIRLG